MEIYEMEITENMDVFETLRENTAIETLLVKKSLVVDEIVELTRIVMINTTPVLDRRTGDRVTTWCSLTKVVAWMPGLDGTMIWQTLIS